MTSRLMFSSLIFVALIFCGLAQHTAPLWLQPDTNIADVIYASETLYIDVEIPPTSPSCPIFVRLLPEGEFSNIDIFLGDPSTEIRQFSTSTCPDCMKSLAISDVTPGTNISISLVEKSGYDQFFTIFVDQNCISPTNLTIETPTFNTTLDPGTYTFLQYQHEPFDLNNTCIPYFQFSQNQQQGDEESQHRFLASVRNITTFPHALACFDSTLSCYTNILLVSGSDVSLPINTFLFLNENELNSAEIGSLYSIAIFAAFGDFGDVKMSLKFACPSIVDESGAVFDWFDSDDSIHLIQIPIANPENGKVPLVHSSGILTILANGPDSSSTPTIQGFPKSTSSARFFDFIGSLYIPSVPHAGIFYLSVWVHGGNNVSVDVRVVNPAHIATQVAPGDVYQSPEYPSIHWSFFNLTLPNNTTCPVIFNFDKFPNTYGYGSWLDKNLKFYSPPSVSCQLGIYPNNQKFCFQRQLVSSFMNPVLNGTILWSMVTLSGNFSFSVTQKCPELINASPGWNFTLSVDPSSFYTYLFNISQNSTTTTPKSCIASIQASGSRPILQSISTKCFPNIFPSPHFTSSGVSDSASNPVILVGTPGLFRVTVRDPSNYGNFVVKLKIVEICPIVDLAFNHTTRIVRPTQVIYGLLDFKNSLSASLSVNLFSSFSVQMSIGWSVDQSLKYSAYASALGENSFQFSPDDFPEGKAAFWITKFPTSLDLAFSLDASYSGTIDWEAFSIQPRTGGQSLMTLFTINIPQPDPHFIVNTTHFLFDVSFLSHENENVGLEYYFLMVKGTYEDLQGLSFYLPEGQGNESLVQIVLTVYDTSNNNTQLSYNTTVQVFPVSLPPDTTPTTFLSDQLTNINDQVSLGQVDLALDMLNLVVGLANNWVSSNGSLSSLPFSGVDLNGMHQNALSVLNDIIQPYLDFGATSQFPISQTTTILSKIIEGQTTAHFANSSILDDASNNANSDSLLVVQNVLQMFSNVFSVVAGSGNNYSSVVEVQKVVVKQAISTLSAISQIAFPTPLLIRQNSTSNITQPTNSTLQQQLNSVNFMSTLNHITSVLSSGLNSQSSTLISTPFLTVHVRKMMGSGLAGKNLSVVDGNTSFAQFSFPSSFEPLVGDGLIDVRMTLVTQNPYSWNPTSKNISSPLLSLSLHHNGQELKISNLSDPISLRIPTNSTKSFLERAFESGANISTVHLQSECRFWNETIKVWSTEGCSFSIADDNYASCSCNHLTQFATFSSLDFNKYLPDMNLLDFQADTEKLRDRLEPTTMLALGALCLIYMFFMHFGRKKDVSEYKKFHTLFAESVYSSQEIHKEISEAKNGFQILHKLKQESEGFWRKLMGTFKEDHLYLSVWFRPRSDTFTRPQRATVILTVILATLLANALFYGKDVVTDEQQIVAGVISALITTPIPMLLGALFKNAKPLKRRWSLGKPSTKQAIQVWTESMHKDSSAQYFSEKFQQRNKGLEASHQEFLRLFQTLPESRAKQNPLKNLGLSATLDTNDQLSFSSSFSLAPISMATSDNTNNTRKSTTAALSLSTSVPNFLTHTNSDEFSSSNNSSNSSTRSKRSNSWPQYPKNKPLPMLLNRSSFHLLKDTTATHSPSNTTQDLLTTMSDETRNSSFDKDPVISANQYQPIPVVQRESSARSGSISIAISDHQTPTIGSAVSPHHLVLPNLEIPISVEMKRMYLFFNCINFAYLGAMVAIVAWSATNISDESFESVPTYLSLVFALTSLSHYVRFAKILRKYSRFSKDNLVMTEDLEKFFFRTLGISFFTFLIAVAQSVATLLLYRDEISIEIESIIIGLTILAWLVCLWWISLTYAPFVTEEDLYWPHWCVNVGYAISWSFAGVAVYMLILYGTKFEQTTAQSWLVSSLVGMTQDIFLQQPLSIFASAAFQHLMTADFQSTFLNGISEHLKLPSLFQ